MKPLDGGSRPQQTPMNTISTSALLLTAALGAGCSQSSGGGQPEVSLAVTADPMAAGSGSPTLLVDGGGRDLLVWADATSRPDSLELRGNRSGRRTRIRVRLDDRLVDRIEDPADGSFVQIEEDGLDRLDFLCFDGGGNFVQGFAVQRTSSGYRCARILGEPVFQGQVNGQLLFPMLTGSYALITDPASELEAGVDLEPSLVAFVDRLAAACAASPVLGAPSDAAAYQLRFAGLLAAALEQINVGDDRWPSRAVSALSFCLTNELLAEFDRTASPSSSEDAMELVSILSWFAADPSAPSGIDFWNRCRAELDLAGRFEDTRVRGLLTDSLVLRGVLSGLADATLPTIPTPIVTGPPAIAVDCMGQAVTQDGAFFPISGTVRSDGSFVAAGDRNGSDPSDRLAIDAMLTGTIVSGSCERGGTMGSVDGSSDDFGDCNTAQQSGGQGTFTFAHFVGGGQGDLDFQYQAFSIPDQFIVRTANGVRFDTMALISGGATVTIALDEEPIVFVSVRAPNNGTAWNYELSCLEAPMTVGGRRGR